MRKVTRSGFRARLTLVIWYTVAITTFVAVLVGIIGQQLIGLAIAALAGLLTMWAAGRQHRDTSRVILETITREDLVYVHDGLLSVMAKRSPKHPLPSMTGKWVRAGRSFAFGLTNGRWAVWTLGRWGVQGWLQHDQEKPGRWHAKHPVDGWIGAADTAEDAIRLLANH